MTSLNVQYVPLNTFMEMCITRCETTSLVLPCVAHWVQNWIVLKNAYTHSSALTASVHGWVSCRQVGLSVNNKKISNTGKPVDSLLLPTLTKYQTTLTSRCQKFQAQPRNLPHTCHFSVFQDSTVWDLPELTARPQPMTDSRHSMSHADSPSYSAAPSQFCPPARMCVRHLRSSFLALGYETPEYMWLLKVRVTHRSGTEIL